MYSICNEYERIRFTTHQVLYVCNQFKKKEIMVIQTFAIPTGIRSKWSMCHLISETLPHDNSDSVTVYDLLNALTSC